MDNLVTTIRNGGPKLSSSKPVSQPVSAGSGLSSGPNPVSSSFKMPPFVKWLSSDDDDDDEKEEDQLYLHHNRFHMKQILMLNQQKIQNCARTTSTGTKTSKAF